MHVIAYIRYVAYMTKQKHYLHYTEKLTSSTPTVRKIFVFAIQILTFLPQTFMEECIA